MDTQGVTKRCCLCWLTNCALVLYMSPNAGGGELRGLSQWVQRCTWSPNKLWRSNSIFCLWWIRTFPCLCLIPTTPRTVPGGLSATQRSLRSALTSSRLGYRSRHCKRDPKQEFYVAERSFMYLTVFCWFLICFVFTALERSGGLGEQCCKKTLPLWRGGAAVW